MEEIKLNVGANVIEAELEHFHHDRGGETRLPRIIKKETQSDFALYELIDGDSVASLTLRPTSKGGCILTFYVNDYERNGWLLGVPGYSELGETTRLGADTSQRCQSFYAQFAEYLNGMGFHIQNDDHKFSGGRPAYEENTWAYSEYKLDRPINEIYLDWLDRRKAAGRPELANSYDSFKKVIDGK